MVEHWWKMFGQILTTAKLDYNMTWL